MKDAVADLTGEARRALVLIYASAQFVVLTAIAMVAYPGGAVYQLDANRYLFLRNFFSDLGATITPSGRPNLTSHILFAIALGSVGLALILASSNWKVIVARGGAARAAGVASQIVEVVAGLGFIGIAATPWNLVLDAHNGFVRLAFGFLLVYDLCLLMIQISNRWTAAYTAANAIYLLLLVAYVGILFFGPRVDTQSGLEFQVAAQKIIVYASVVNLGLQAVSIRRAAGRRMRDHVPA
ncbi:MAG: hypothetical protein WBQ79_16315 [Acidobacteriaceae bacterium]